MKTNLLIAVLLLTVAAPSVLAESGDTNTGEAGCFGDYSDNVGTAWGSVATNIIQRPLDTGLAIGLLMYAAIGTAATWTPAFVACVVT